VWLKSFLMGAWGLLKVGTLKLTGAAANLVTTVWKSRLFGVARIGLAAGASWIGSLFGALGIGGALGAIGYFGLLAIAAVGIVVGGFFVLNALSNKIFGIGIADVWTNYINSLFERSETGGWMATELPGAGGNWDQGVGLGALLTPKPGGGNPNRDHPLGMLY
jgi:hypothetical protein